MNTLDEIRSRSKRIAFDTETTGLRPYHGKAHPFVFTITTDYGNTYFFACKTWRELQGVFGSSDVIELTGSFSEDHLIRTEYFADGLKIFFNQYQGVMFIHNAKYDRHVIETFVRTYYPEWEIRSDLKIICTKILARLVFNDHMKYDLDSCGHRIGMPKDGAVHDWIMANKAYDIEEIPGKSVKKKDLHFYKVPVRMMFEYACRDTEVCMAVGNDLMKQLSDAVNGEKHLNRPNLSNILDLEMRFAHVIHRMEALGVPVDPDHCRAMIAHGDDMLKTLKFNFKDETGEDYKASPKLFERIFASERDKWAYTDNGNPSFSSDVIEKFQNPVAKTVIKLREYKSQNDFMNGFLYHKDAFGRIHPNFNSDGTGTGRLSSSDPNFQNLANQKPGACRSCMKEVEYLNEECCSTPSIYAYTFLVRSAIKPSEGYDYILSLDYQAMEYRMMLELAARLAGRPGALLQEVLAGKDVHQATADLASGYGITISRQAAKMANFLTIYGGGPKKLAEGLGCSEDEARNIIRAIFRASPEISNFIHQVKRTAEIRGFVYNWMGRRSYFPNRNFSYRAPNYLIQGGCADVMKTAMVNIAEWLEPRPKDCRMLMTVHDELIFEVTESFILSGDYKHLQRLMIEAFPSQFLPMDTSAAYGPDLGHLSELAA